MDDKAGRGAFDDAQAQRHIQNRLEHGGQLADRDGVLLDGLVYRCSDRDTADGDLKGLQRVIDRYPGGLDENQLRF